MRIPNVMMLDEERVVNMLRSYSEIMDITFNNVKERLKYEARQIDKYHKRIKNRNKTKKRG